jgi:hypothetical protein
MEEVKTPEQNNNTVGRHIFLQKTGPCVEYKRSVEVPANTNEHATEHTQWSLDIPWFGWIFRPLIVRHMKHRHHKTSLQTTP